MLVYPVNTAPPIAPVAPVAKIAAKPAKAARKASDGPRAATYEARSPSTLASHNTRAALDEMKLGG